MERNRTPLRLLTLKPYGEQMASPGVLTWLRSAWTVIFLMALVEGTVWALIGRELAPGNSALVEYAVSAFAFLGIFSLIWVVDASFIMAEKPLLHDPKRVPKVTSALDRESPWRWRFGVGIRILIVLISLLVTAPLLTLVIRADQIDNLYQEKLATAELARSERERDLFQEAQERATQSILAQLTPLLDRRERLELEIEKLRNRLAAPSGGYERELAILDEEFQRRQQDLIDEEQGVYGIPGRGPNWERKKRELDQLIVKRDDLRAEAEAATSQERAAIQRRLTESEGQLTQLSKQIAPLETELAQARAQFSAESSAEQEDDNSPALEMSLGLRWLLLEELLADERDITQTLRRSNGFSRDIDPETKLAHAESAGFFTNVGHFFAATGAHFRTVDGLAQAILVMLFLALLALKLFEPKSVRLYFNEELRLAWQDYLRGYYDLIPGFRPGGDASLRMNHNEFTRALIQYQENRETFLEEYSQRLESDNAFRERHFQAELQSRLIKHMGDHEIAHLAKRYEDDEARRRLLREDLERELKRKAEQEEERFQQQQKVAEERIKQMKEAGDAELALRKTQWEHRKAQEDRAAALQREKFEREMEEWKAWREIEFKKLAQEKEELLKESELKAQELALDHQLKRFKAEVDVLRGEVDALIGSREQFDQAATRLGGERRELERQIEERGGRAAELDEQIKADEAEIATLRQKIASIQKRMDESDPEDEVRWEGLHRQRTLREQRLIERAEALQSKRGERKQLDLELTKLRREQEDLTDTQREQERRWDANEERLALIREKIEAFANPRQG